MPRLFYSFVPSLLALSLSTRSAIACLMYKINKIIYKCLLIFHPKTFVNTIDNVYKYMV